MIENLGIGIDIVDVNRFRNMPYDEKYSFYNNIFNQNEINYCLKFKDPYTHFAGKFALKEAVIKSINQKEAYSNIITDHVDKQPTVKILEKNEYKFLATISHEKKFAVGVVIAEKHIKI
jgi:holo-[acyl-carrier protein] synthase